MNLWLLDLEAHETRYTSQWRDHLPGQLERAAKDRGRDDVRVRVVEGIHSDGGTSPGAFLNFAGTNIYKSSQLMQVAQAFRDGDVRPHDRFLITDAWHPGIIQIRYMADLLDIPIGILALWHSGSYDRADFLGRKIADKRWSFAFERALYHAIDVNCFATEFHIEMFKAALGIEDDSRILRTGWPTEHIRAATANRMPPSERRLVMFPHRLAPEKQVEIFDDLAPAFPEFEFFVAQRHGLTKAEYYARLRESLLVFSASQQETLGIGIYEGLLSGAIPLVPDRLSYAEIYPAEFRYPSEWTEDWAAYQDHKTLLCERMRAALTAAATSGYQQIVNLVKAELEENFFKGTKLYDQLFDMEYRSVL